MLRAISSFAAGRRTKWLVLAIWVMLGFALGSFQPKLQDATTNENEAFLPESAESTEVNDLVEERFPDGREVDVIVAYERDEGLGPADFQRIAGDARRICDAELDGLILVIDPRAGPVCGEGGAAVPLTERAELERLASGGAGPSPVSEDGTTALLLVRTNSEESEEIQSNVDAIRDIAPEPGGDGLQAYVTGIGGIIADSIETFESIDVTLLLVTVILVLTLLLLIYRSPVVALVPLFVVGIAYSIAAAAVYGLVQAGAVEVNGQTTSLLIVLMFGAGTDYCLLIVSRYREELRRTEDKHEAMAHATERTAPAILSAGATVFAAMLVLTLADFKATQTMGPVLALGVAIMILAGLTLLPALLAVLGRNSFWPAIPRKGTEARKPLDVWRRVGHLVHDRPWPALICTVVFLGIGALGALQDRGTLDFGEGFRNDPDSVQGQELIDEKLDAGQTAVTTVVTPAAQARSVSAALSDGPHVAAVTPSGVSEDAELARIDVTLDVDPFSDQASDSIPLLRERVDEPSGGAALVGGTSAENYDTTEALRSDAQIIVPLVLLLIFLILCVLLRAIVAPLYLVGTVVLSFLFAIGASNFIFSEIFNQPDGDPGLPTFAFIFLVALGVDYNIFLISRIREEAEHEETKEAVITGLEKTGGVITSAGLILAGTFCALMTLPLEVLFQIGFTVAFGLLIDTFLVRTILVPSIAFLLGPRNWWPGRVNGGRGGGGARPEARALAD